MKIDAEIALEVASHEGIVRQAYFDTKNVLTWSIGITNATGHNVERYRNNPQPMAYCLQIFVWALERYAKDVRAAFAGKTLTKAQFAAALSFHYNTGAIARATWVKLWKEGRVSEARQSIMSWTKDKELTSRRAKERDLFFDGKWSNYGFITEYTKVSATGQPIAPKRVNIRNDMIRALGGTVAPVKEVITTVGGGGGAAVVAKKEGLSWSEAVGIGLAVAVLVGVGWLIWKRR
jgi:lysozyme